MRYLFALGTGCAGLALLASPAAAQHQHMPGMVMPMPDQPKAKAPKKKAAPKKSKTAVPKPAPANPAAHQHKTQVKPEAASPAAEPSPGAEMDHSTMDHSTMDHSTMDHSTMDHSTMDHSTMDDSTMGDSTVDHSAMEHDMPGHAMAGHAGGEGGMSGALGTYPMTRESSGTAWQPDNSEHAGVHVMSGAWMLMGHGVLNLVADHQSGPRGADKLFASGMLMGMAQRPIGNGTLQFRAMLSPDPLMGKRGYPLLLASGETADGVTHLVDRQHPHDLFMELSASISQNIGGKSSVFLYGGLPGEPAFGPPAFMHREAILDSPEAPISHHWLDSTHISFGVVTAGLVVDRVKLEVSRFNAREPDQHRWNIETAPLDSTAVRLSWNPNDTLSLQGSWGDFKHPEQLEPEVNQKRLSASLLYAKDVAPGWKLAGTLAWGRKSANHHSDDAFAGEASLKHRQWTIFSRAEMTENRELIEGSDRAYRVGKVSLGAIYDIALAPNLSFGIGGLAALNFVPDSIARDYGGNHPTGAMGFVRLKID